MTGYIGQFDVLAGSVWIWSTFSCFVLIFLFFVLWVES